MLVPCISNLGYHLEKEKSRILWIINTNLSWLYCLFTYLCLCAYAHMYIYYTYMYISWCIVEVGRTTFGSQSVLSFHSVGPRTELRLSGLEPAPLPSESFHQLFISNRRMVSLMIDAKKDWKYYRLPGARECFLYLRLV